MKKIEDLFNEGDGMTIEGSTSEQRKEVWELLFNKKLIYAQEDSLKKELSFMNNNAITFDSLSNLFVPCFAGDADENILIDDFKNRLLQLND